MAYTKIVYQNSPSTATPLNAENLNHMDDQIALNDQRLTALEGAHVSSFNSRTGAITSEKGDYDIDQIVASDGQEGYIPVWRNNGTEQEPDWGFEMEEMGGSGHEIIDSEGNTMPQESAMQFPDSHVSDDSTNGRTVVENVKEHTTKADYDNATEDGFHVIDDGNDVPIGEIEEDYEEVIADGDTTYEDLFILLHSKIDASKVTKEAKLVRGTDDLFIFHMGINYLNKTAPNNYADFFSLDATGGRTQDCDIIRLGSSPAYYTLNGGTGAGTNHLTQKPSDGSVWRFYYGTSSTVINLLTDARHCMMSDGQSVESAITVTKTQFVPKVGTSSSLATRNFYVTDNRTFLEVHFCLSSTTAIADQSEIMDLPIIAQNKIFQYDIAAENKSRNTFIVSNSNTALVLTGATTAQNGNYLFGTFRMSLLA